MPDVDFPLFWRLLGRLVGLLLGEKAHAEVVIVIRDGRIQNVRTSRQYLPQDLPKV